jgi:hypothetical protein
MVKDGGAGSSTHAQLIYFIECVGLASHPAPLRRVGLTPEGILVADELCGAPRVCVNHAFDDVVAGHSTIIM